MVETPLTPGAERPILSLQGISTSYDGSRILHGVSLDLYRRRVTTIIGPSGGGKTTLLKTIDLLLMPEEGRIVFEDETVFDAALHREVNKTGLGRAAGSRIFQLFHGRSSNAAYRRHFGMVFQDYNLWPNLTIYDNIAAPLRWALRLSESEVQRRVEEHADIVRIGHILAKFPSEASGGERQRAAIARALSTEPDVLLLDEVTAALDVELAAEVLQLILRLKEAGHTMVLVTHHLQFAARISDTIAFLHGGQIKEARPARYFFESPATPELSQFLDHISWER